MAVGLRVDSKAVNKLIRSEIWPLLRGWGFTVFEARTAWRYIGEAVDVVEFYSFTSMQAEEIGCTTYSFGLHLGVDVREAGETGGEARPDVWHCMFLKGMRKRSAVDGFRRDDVFYVAADGSSVAAVFQEVKDALERTARPWFDRMHKLEDVVAAMEKGLFTKDESDGALPGSYLWHKHLSSLLLALRRRRPPDASGERCLEQLNRTIGVLLDLPHVTDTAAFRERDARPIRGMLRELEGEVPLDCDLLSARWSAHPAESPPAETVSPPPAKQSLWPTLRRLGFHEFTDRLAHRVVGRAVEVIAFVPPTPAERRQHKLPPHLFRLAAGVFWPEFARNDLARMNARGQYRPTIDDCFLNTWLISPRRSPWGGPSCFTHVEDALAALEHDAEDWFVIWRSEARRDAFLSQDDWRIFSHYPLMRGTGARDSMPRVLLAGVDSLEDPNRFRDIVARAEESLAGLPQVTRRDYERWLRHLEGREAKH